VNPAGEVEADRAADRAVRRPTAAGAAPPPEFVGEAIGDDGAWTVRGSTRLFIQPTDPVAAADALVTNFHLPGSSLLMLVAAMAGPAVWREVYEHAVRQRFRFYSYGDAMLILPATPAGGRAPGDGNSEGREYHEPA
jgi:S-adenosylmethionine:tRNA ribosyltransferase-isomerase